MSSEWHTGISGDILCFPLVQHAHLLENVRKPFRFFNRNRPDQHGLSAFLIRPVVFAAVKSWAEADGDVASIREIEETHWNSRMFSVRLAAALEVGFWQSENPEHGVEPVVEGNLSAEGMKFALVTTRWNTVITDRLLQGALDCLKRSGAVRADIEVVRVPGAWEIPNAARTLAESSKYDAIVTLGCLLRGETAHYEAIYNEVARGIGQSQQDTGVPHAFGVLTCETLEQALDRAGLKAGNKGFEAASAAIEMVSIQRKLRGAN